MLIKFQESLDQFYPFERVEDHLPANTRSEYHFYINSNLFSFRFRKAHRPGTFAWYVQLGKLVGTKMTQKLTGVTDFRKFFSTIANIVLHLHANPSSKLKQVHGMAVRMNAEDFDKYERILKRAIRMKLRGKYKMMEGFHDDYMGEEGIKVLYLYQFGKSFKQVFNHIPADILDGVPDEDPDKEPESKPVSKSLPAAALAITPAKAPTKVEPVAEPVSAPEQPRKIAGVPVVVEPETKPQVPDFVDDFNSFVKKNAEPLVAPGQLVGKPYKDFTKEELDEGWKLVMANSLIHEMGRKDDYINGDTRKLKLLVTIIASGVFKDKMLSERQLIVKLNLAGIKTSYVWDIYRNYGNDPKNSIRDVDSKKRMKRYPWRFIESPEITDSMIPDSHVDINQVSWDRLFEIYEHDDGFTWSEEGKSSSRYTIRSADLGTLLDAMPNEEKIDMFMNIQATLVEKEPIEEIQWYTDDTGSGKHLDFNNQFKDNDLKNLLQGVGFDLFKSLSTPEIEKVVDSVHPVIATQIDGLYVKDFDIFKGEFVSSWTIAHGSSSQAAAFAWLSDDFIFNTVENPLWKGGKDNVYLEKTAPQSALDNFRRIYDETQEFLKQKMKKKYDTGLIKLYRGVGLHPSEVTNYVPGALESWSLELNTAKRFADMMSPSSHKGSVLTVEVPATAVFATYQSLAGWFPAEKYLKGKKEYIVLGGAFKQYPVKVLDLTTKEPTAKIKFSEWIERLVAMNEQKSKERTLDIVFTDHEDFDDILNNTEKTVTGLKVEPEGDIKDFEDLEGQ